MTKSINRIFTLTKRNLKEILRDPLSVVFIIGLPLFMEIFFYLIFHNLTIQFEMKYLAPGIVVFSQAFLTLFMGLLISLDRNTSFLTRLYVSKAKAHEFIISYSLALLPIVLIQSILFFIVGGIFDVNLFKLEMVFAVLISMVTSFLFLGLGLLFGSLCNEKSIGGVSSIVISLHSVLSGMWFPVDDLDKTMTDIMNILPFKNATILVQNTLNGVNDLFNDFLKPLVIIIFYTLVIFIISILVFKSNMKKK